MSATIDKKRRQAVQRLSIAAVALWIILLLMSLFAPTTSDVSPRTGDPVLKNFSAVRGDTGSIRFTMADLRYTLERDGSEWVMAETGGYPVRKDRLNTLAEGLETLSWGERRTSDPDRLSRIGLGDPREGGNGILVEVFTTNGTKTAEMIVGRRNEQLYARDPNETISFRAEGDLPPLYTREAWLDLDIVEIDPSAISAVRISDSQGDSLYLTRDPGDGPRSFAPAPPYQNDRLRSRLAASTPALAIARLAPIDVKPASELTTRPVARHITETHDGLEIDLRAWNEPDGHWVTLRAVEAGEGARRAQTINDQAEGWAFKLTEYDWREFTPLVTSIVRRPDPAEGQAPIESNFQP
ncbi:DUF4340 domain-containing protein [Henriciella aquimarina]|uniref:DUF4340 domain-containing protein n=1 Tax=Henriciella aquimarina TaxID=545261 RepID=UPI0009FE81D9|nr:DUF4340 domain-containing protein [Henriciella aquimarina]